MKRTPNIAFIWQSGIYLFSNILSAAIPFLLLPVLTRHLTPAEYGEVAMFQTFLLAIAAFTGLSVHGAARRKYYDPGVTHEDMRAFISSCVQLLAFSTILVLAFVGLFGSVLESWVGVKENWLLAAVFVSACTFLGQLRLGQWQVRQQPVAFGALRVSQSFVNATISIGLVVVVSMGPEGRFWGITLAGVFVACVAVISLTREGLLAFIWHRVYIKEAAKFGIPLIPHVGGIFLLSVIDRFIVKNKLGLDQAGIYMVAVQLTMALDLIFDAIRSAYVPWLYERLQRNDTSEKIQIVKMTYLYFIGLLVIAFGSWLFGPKLVALIVGGKYSGAGDIVWLLVMGQVFNGMYHMISVYIFYSKRTLALSAITLLTGVLNVSLLLLLVETMGIIGAAISFAVSMAVRFILSWAVSINVQPMPWFRLRKPAG